MLSVSTFLDGFKYSENTLRTHVDLYDTRGQSQCVPSSEFHFYHTQLFVKVRVFVKEWLFESAVRHVASQHSLFPPFIGNNRVLRDMLPYSTL